MWRLVPFMIGSCECYRSQQVKADDTIRLWILYRLALRCRLQSLVVRICNGIMRVNREMIRNNTTQTDTDKNNILPDKVFVRMNKLIQADTLHLPFNIIPLHIYSSAPISAANTFQDLPQLCESADNTERYI
jgi:hypothetical protein